MCVNVQHPTDRASAVMMTCIVPSVCPFVAVAARTSRLLLQENAKRWATTTSNFTAPGQGERWVRGARLGKCVSMESDVIYGVVILTTPTVEHNPRPPPLSLFPFLPCLETVHQESPRSSEGGCSWGRRHNLPTRPRFSLPERTDMTPGRNRKSSLLVAPCRRSSLPSFSFACPSRQRRGRRRQRRHPLPTAFVKTLFLIFLVLLCLGLLCLLFSERAP